MRFMRSREAAGLAGVLAVLLLAAGCAGTPARDARESGATAIEPTMPATGGRQQAADSLRTPITNRALAMVGVPYRYGGDDPDEGFDCSGLVYYAYTSSGHGVPRTSQDQFDAARKITLADAAEGDLVFFRDQEKLSHVGIYLGDGRFVHAPSSGGSVRVADLESPYYQRHLVAVGRLLP
jgi:cell wall-associated NlpC family hydrolase